MTDKVEIAWGGSFYDDPAALVWTDVTARAFPGVSAALGRESNLDATPQARRMSLRLKSYDGALTPGNTASPYWPNVVSGVPIRTSKRDAAGVWWPVFYGLTDTFNPTMNGEVADYTVVQVAAVSAWAYLTQAGARRTYADRVVGDLAPAKGEVWEAGSAGGTQTYVMYVAGGVIYPGRPYMTGVNWPDAFEGGTNFQRWGFAWLKLDNTGAKTWATPGAGCPVVETGGADSSGQASGPVFEGGFASDRPGGQFIGVGTASTISVGTGVSANYSRMQVMVGRPPTQLAPVGVSAPTTTTGWTASAGALTLVAASTLAHLPRTTAYDPTTKTTAAAAINGPANAISWACPVGAQTLSLPNVPVVAGKTYCPSMVMSGLGLSVSVRWLNNVGGLISTSPTMPAPAGVFLYGFGIAGFLAPAGAVNAQVQVGYDGLSGAQTVTVGCAGFYEVAAASGLSPARWWPVGADAKIWAWVQWPDLLAGGMTTGTAGQIRWLHVAIDVTGWDDGALHMIGWNGWPGVGGNPVVWADNVRVTTGWSVSYPGANVGSDTAHVGAYNGSGMGGGFGTNAGARANTTNPSKLVVPAALLGAYQYEVTPDDVSIARAYSFFGGKKTIGATYATDTGAQMTQALDQLGWPVVLRDISVGASTLPTTWGDLGSLSDYSALIGDLTKAEYGWVDIGPDGKLVWKPRAWYGVGTATAVARYTWRTPGPANDTFPATFPETFGIAAVVGTQYLPPLDVRWDDKDLANSVVVSNGTDVMTRSRQDLTRQRRGLRKLVVTLPGGATQPAIDAIADILAVVHAPGPRVEALVLRAFGADDPMLAQILARRTGDVVLVDLPQKPALDLSVPMLITSIEHTSDGVVWSAKFTLGVCPIPAVYP